MSAKIYLEGGGGRQDSKALKVACRMGFGQLFESMGYSGKMPQLVACGSRDSTMSDLKTACTNRQSEYVAMLIDSEDPVAAPEKTWDHLKARDGWERPENCSDEAVLFMTTCMETWITTDRKALKEVYGDYLQESALPSSFNIEWKQRHEIQDTLMHATRNSPKPYSKGKESFELVGKLNPGVLEKHLVAFRRMKRILDKTL